MNLPNKLTVMRVIMIPFFVISLLAFQGEVRLLRNLAAAIFIVASLTDMLDGKIARKYNLVTNFGKFMDPLADKLLVCSALICLIELGQLPAWMVIIIVSREFIISGFRLIAAEQGIVIAASYWGKFKTTFLWQKRQRLQAPAPQGRVICLGIAHGHQMSDTPGHHRGIGLNVAVRPSCGNLQRVRKLLGHTGFLRYV